MLKFKILLVLGVISLVGVGCFASSEPTATEPVEIDRDTILFNAKSEGLIMSDDEMEQMNALEVTKDSGGSTKTTVRSFMDTDFSTWRSAALADVTGGGSFGLAHAQFQDGTYTFVANMGGLPGLDENYFYEGWVVRRGTNLSIVSTGRAEIVEDKFVNVYVSSSNLLDHDFYVLTLEPVDEDPAPSEHILEGIIK